MRLENKVAIITGAGSGIGRGISLAFAKEGAKVVVSDVNENGAKETVEMVKAAGGEAIFVKTDVSQKDEIDKMVKTCLGEFGKVDILVNNAGIVKSGSIEEMEEKDWDRVIEVNLKSVFLGSKRVIPEMLKQGRGKIISTTSIAGIVGFNKIGAYCASKGGIIALTKSMSLDYAPLGINVNCIAPGVIETGMTKEMLDDPQQKSFFQTSTPYPRLGVPQDIAMAAVYLASEESDFVNGHVLVVDGGWIAK
jgi:NAD(P)-dependent dehydrogenase (short-subunit alcohol dehydrogenase family)